MSLNHQVADEDVVTSELFPCPFSYAGANYDDQYLPSKHCMEAGTAWLRSQWKTKDLSDIWKSRKVIVIAGHVKTVGRNI